MKGYVAFCPHFHQPHFQLLRTREEAFRNSYLPWLKLLQQSVGLDNFYINLHFSGPLLYWFKDQKPEYLTQLKDVLSTGKAGIIGGMLDEPFIQLSSRLDDYYYQLKKYDELCYGLTGIKADQWQGIHLVERECGELLLREATRAAGLIGAPAIYYLDAETFYQPHFSYPGGDHDYCWKHFNFKDLFSKTTITHIPADMLYYSLRDEIGGQPFYALPVHSQFRYQLLKRSGFTSEDITRVKPRHYYFYIKDALENAARMAGEYGRNLAPIVVIFEDAEKMGQWSKDPEGDSAWLLEFFNLVNEDKDIKFIGLRDYIVQTGIFETYPVSSSRSYPEWENWTAKRGIRGVTFGDERLRRVMSRLREFESRQSYLEDLILQPFTRQLTESLDGKLAAIVARNVSAPTERFDMTAELLEKQYSLEFRRIYELVNRIRNVVYQEDPKWASRHPCYGSSPYYDMQGLAYLEMAERIIENLINTIAGKEENSPTAVVRDWDFDGIKEVIVKSQEQTLCIDPEGGCISYHHILSSAIAGRPAEMVSVLGQDMEDVKAYNAIYRYSYPLVFTETDSDLNLSYYQEGGRRETCRNSFRCRLLVLHHDRCQPLGNFEQGLYQIDEVKQEQDTIMVRLSLTEQVNVADKAADVTLIKEFIIGPDKLSLALKVVANGIPEGRLFAAPQIVTSAAPSDEVDFHPRACLGFIGRGDKIAYTIQDIALEREGGYEFRSQEDVFPKPAAIDYLYRVTSGEGSSFENRVTFDFSGQPCQWQALEIKPAVKHYYKDYVFAQQSRLGYYTSGLLMEPLIPVEPGETSFQVDIFWSFAASEDRSSYQYLYELVEG